MTKRKNGETLKDIAPALRYADYVFPNLDEAYLLTGDARRVDHRRGSSSPAG